MMQKIIILLAVLSLILPSVASAKLYKCKNNEGEVVYTDKPCENEGEELKLPPLPTYTPRPVSAPTRGSQPVSQSADYTSLEVVEPVNDKLIISTSGTVTIAFKIKGPLLSLKGHRVALAVDGTKLKARGTTNQIRLTDLNPGTHTVKIFVVDKEDKELISSDVISFHIKRQSNVTSPRPGQPPGASVPSTIPGGGNTIPGSSGTLPGGAR